MNAERLASYIRAQIGAAELTDWTVAVLAGDGEMLEFGEMTFHTLERSPVDRGRAPARYIVKTMLAPRDEAIDLDASDYGEAVEFPTRSAPRRANRKTTRPTVPKSAVCGG